MSNDQPALQPERSDLDGLPDALQPFYAKDTQGKFRLRIDGIDLTDARAALTRAADLDRQRKVLTDTMLAFAAREAIKTHKGNEEVLLPHVLGQLTTVEENGVLAVRVAGAGGKPRATESGAPVTADAVVQSLRINPSFAGLFAPLDAKGGGAVPGLRLSAPETFTITRAEAGDPRAYRAAKARAKAAGKSLTISG